MRSTSFHSILGLLIFSATFSHAHPPWVRLLEDAPGRLSVELRPPAPTLVAAGPAGQSRPACAGCQMAATAGAPDLPFYRFDVLSGAAAPQVTLHVLESESRVLPGGLASIPFQPNPRRLEYRPSPELFRAAAGLAPKVGGLRYLRGAPMRGVEIPLATWNEGTRTLTLIRRMRVEVAFPAVRPRAARLKLPQAFRRAVMNPDGGAFLYEAEPRRPYSAKEAAKRAAGADGASPYVGQPGEKFLRIQVGDDTVANLREDQFYAVSFAELARASQDIRGGIRLADLRLYTGHNDTLKRRMDSLPQSVASEPGYPTVLKGLLREIPMEFVDGNDNTTFDEGDSLLFFAHGTSTWKRIPGDQGPIRYEFTVDPYSFRNSYYLGYAGQKAAGAALRLPGDPGLPPAAPVLEATAHYLRAEEDRETASCDPSAHKDEESGFAWFWHWKGRCDTYIDTTVTLTRSMLASRETETLVDLVRDPARKVYVGMYTYGQGKADDNFKVYLRGRVDTVDTSHHSFGRWFELKADYADGPSFSLDSAVWSGRTKRYEGYSVSYPRRHEFRGSPLWIFPEKTGARQTYQVAGAPAGTQVLRIVDGVAGRRLALDASNRFTDSLPPDADARYLVFRNAGRLPSGAITEESLPAKGSAIRDLLSGDGENPEYLIITGRSLAAEAASLKAYRNDTARALRLRTSVVHVEDIYRVFGSGRMSPPAIRDFIRWAYHYWHPSGGASPLRFVALFGDGHYDYRGIHAARKGASVPNVVPPYEFIVESGGEEVASENFYANLDPGDNHMDSALMDVAIGRIPVQTPGEAARYIEKVKAYEDPREAGDWRSRVVLAADDHLQRGNPPNNFDPITRGHTTDSDRLGRAMLAVEPGITLDRVYLIDYPMNSSFRKPEAAQDILAQINRGSLMINYVGHGSSNQWADEVLLQTSDALSRLSNTDRTGLVNAFSCTVGRFESLTSEGMSEQFVKQPGVGAIGAVSATRESFPLPNIALASAFYSRVFRRDTATGQGATVGEALMEAKNALETSDNLNDMKYALLGEPVLLLRKPLLKVGFTRAPDTLRALDCDRLEGTIAGGTGSGMVNVKINAGSQFKIYDLPSPMEAQYADKRGSILFERTVPYKDGKFSMDYFLPRQIAFGDTNAVITAFAWDGGREAEGTVALQDLRIRGTAGTCPADTNGKGPTIRISGCERKETGGLDFPDRVKLSLPYCLQVQVEDSVGGVLSADGPDEGTVFEIPGVLDPFHPQPGIDELYSKNYQLTLERKDFKPGPYVLKVSAKDGYGNVSQRTLRMDLTRDSSLQAITAYNVPNPVKRAGTAFYFSTILPQEEVDVTVGGQGREDRLAFEVRIFDQSGRVVRVIRKAVSGVRWDGRDEWGNRAANGVYFYVVTARWRQDPALPTPSYRTLSTRRNTLVLSR